MFNKIEGVVTDFISWLAHDLPEGIIEAAGWLFRGETPEITVKLAVMLVLLICVFTYSCRSPAGRVPKALVLLMTLIGVSFWGAALVVVASFLFR